MILAEIGDFSCFDSPNKFLSCRPPLTSPGNSS
ncbi:MAG: hypothetical protein ACLRPB_04640 [Lawsonibacter sp.]